MNAVKHGFAIMLCGLAVALPSSFCVAQQVIGELGTASAHEHHKWKTNSAAAFEIRRSNQGEGL